MLRDVAHRRLRRPQQRRVQVDGQGPRVAVDCEVGGRAIGGDGRGCADAGQGDRQVRALERGRPQRRDETAGLGEVVRGDPAGHPHRLEGAVVGPGFPGRAGAARSIGGGASGVGRGASGIGRGAPVVLQIPLRRVQQHLDAGQPLRDGVVDLVGQALPLLRDTRGALGLRELAAGGDELVDEFLPLPVDPPQRAERVVDGQYHRRRHRRPHDPADGQPTGDLGDHRDRRGEDDRDHPADVIHHPQIEEEQGEHQVDTHRGDEHRDDPQARERHEPHHPGGFPPLRQLRRTVEVQHREPRAQQQVERRLPERQLHGRQQRDDQEHRREDVDPVGEDILVGRHGACRGGPTRVGI